MAIRSHGRRWSDRQVDAKRLDPNGSQGRDSMSRPRGFPSLVHSPPIASRIYIHCAFRCPSVAPVAASARFVSKRLALCISLIYPREKATISGRTRPVWIPLFPRLSLGRPSSHKTLYPFWIGRGVTLIACCFPLFPARQNLVLSRSCIPWYTIVAFIYSWLRELVQG